jgi:PKD domain
MALPATAAATTTYCVPATTIAGCPAGGNVAGSIGTAIAAGSNGDEILIGPGTFYENVNDGGKALQFVGEGSAATVIQGNTGSPSMRVSAGSSVSNLGVSLPGATNQTGLSLAGTATGVAVTAMQPASTMNNIGVDLVNGGTFSHGSVTLPLTGGDDSNYGGAIGDGTVSDSSVSAAVGVTGDGSGNVPTVARVRIIANQGYLDSSTSPATIDDSLIRTVAGSAPEVGIGMGQFGTITARHLTVIGSGGVGSTGLSAGCVAATAPVATSVLLASSILRGYSTSISATAVPGIGPISSATTTVRVDHSFYDPGTTFVSAPVTVPPTATATITADSHSGNFDSLFIDPSAADFHLRAGSPAIDGGDPAALASGESTTDVDGNPRIVAGHQGHAAISDVGAYEFQPHAPTVSAHTGPGDAFVATGSDPSSGDSVSFRWSFDDGTSATGAIVTHAFAKPGHHTATVTATDLDGFTATAIVSVTVASLPRPKLMRLAVKRGFVSYRDSQAAMTTFTLLRRKHGRHYARVATFTRHDRSGANRFKLTARLKNHRLRRGRYRLVGVPRDAAGSGPPATASFTIKR